MGLGIKEKLGHFKGDKVILILVAALACFSILLVSSTEGMGVFTHIIHLIVAAIAATVAYFLDYKNVLHKGRGCILLIAIGLLSATLASSAVRGISIRGHSFQTFYFIGLLVIVWLSNFLGRRIDDGETLIPKGAMNMATFVAAAFCTLIGILNMSTAIILFLTCIALFYIGRISMRRILSIVGIAVVLIAILSALVATKKLDNFARFDTFVSRWEYYFTQENNNGYGDQMIMSKTAIARSGIKPAGPGRGVIKYRLPEKATDYAYASLFEETGLVVGIIIILLYTAFFIRAWLIAKKAKSAIGSLLAFGIGFWLTCQAFVHIGVNCCLLPATGQTLPFISVGGTSLIVSGFAVGILLNVSKRNVMEEGLIDAKDKFIQSDRYK